MKTTKPQRIVRKRTRGWRMPANTVCVTRPGKWGNPYKTTWEYPACAAVRDFKLDLMDELFRRDYNLPINLKHFHWMVTHLIELRGKNLACYCKRGAPCHADVLLELANL